MNSCLKIFVTLCACATLSGSALAAEADQYWEISKIPPRHSSAQKMPNMYWRTHVVPGGRVEIYDLCNNDKLAFNATGDKFEWDIKSDKGSQTAKVDDQGSMQILLDVGTLYASGHAIEKIACKNGKPTSKPQLIVPKWNKPTTTSGAAHLEAAVGKTLIVTRPRSPTPGRPETSERVGANTLVCKGAPMTEEAVRTLTDSPALARNPQLWPGNLIRGKDLSEGPQAKFTPITVRRGPGTISIEGVNFKDPDAQVSIDIERVSEANIKQAIKKLLSQEIASTEATIAFDTKQVYSNDQLAFEMGVDSRFSTDASFSSSLKVDTNSKKNYVLARFQQIYYTISFEDPESRYSVFEKEDEFKDPENQIGADNPPLYIKQVGYGRSLYFLASSTDSGTAVKAALEGAYGNKEAAVYLGVNSESNYQSVMSNTSMSYYALGGNSVAMIQPLKEATPEKVYGAIRTAIANAKAAQVSELSQGLPISYSLNYLTSRSPASMGYSTSYDLTECQIFGTSYYSFAVEQSCVDDYVDIEIQDPLKLVWEPVTHLDGGKGTTVVNLDLFTKAEDKNYSLRIKEYNIAGPSCSQFTIRRDKFDQKTGKLERMYLQSDGSSFGPNPNTFYEAGDWLVGNRSMFTIKFNRQTGAAQVTHRGA